MRLEKSNTDGYIVVLLGFARSPFRGFESYLRIVVGLDEDDIQLTLKQNKSNFITYELSPGTCTIKVFQRLFTQWVIMKNLYKLNMMILVCEQIFLNSFWWNFGALSFDETSFFKTFFGFFIILGF